MSFASFARSDMKLLARHGFVVAYAAVGLFYAALVRVLPPDWAAAILPVLVWSDPVFFGFFFAGATVCLDLAQGSYGALAVTPFTLTAYVLAKSLNLAILAFGLALGLSFAGRGLAFYPLRLGLAVLLGLGPAVLFGAALAFRLRTVNRFIVGAMPFMLALALPVAAYAGAGSLPSWLLAAARLSPGEGALAWARASYGGGAPVRELLYGTASALAWTGLGSLALSRAAARAARGA